MAFFESSFHVMSWIILAVCAGLVVVHLYYAVVKFRHDRLGRSVEYVNLVTFAIILIGTALVLPNYRSDTPMSSTALFFSCASMTAIILWGIFAWNVTRHGVRVAARRGRSAAVITVIVQSCAVSPALLLAVAADRLTLGVVLIALSGVLFSAMLLYSMFARLNRITQEVVG